MCLAHGFASHDFFFASFEQVYSAKHSSIIDYVQFIKINRKESKKSEIFSTQNRKLADFHLSPY